MVKKPDISLIICSHNRLAFLKRTLPYYSQIESGLDFELIVVLNACTDESEQWVSSYFKSNDGRCISEPRLGLSHARNTGWKASTADVVVYIDDDAYPKADLLLQIKSCLENQNVQAFSGHPLYWNHNESKWIIAQLVEVQLFANRLCELPKSGFINGCICGFRRQVLESYDGFKSQYGMRGTHIGYAEEVEIQHRIQQEGGLIIYNPELRVYHASHFQTIRAFLVSSYRKGQYAQRLNAHVRWKHAAKSLFFFIFGLIQFLPLAMAYNFKAGLVLAMRKPAYHLGRSTAK